MTFNIATKAVTETTEIKINDPATGDQLTGEGGKPCSVTVYGPGSKPYLAAQAVDNAKMVKRARARGNAPETAEEAIARKAALLASITVSFNGFDYNGGPNERETFKACYSDPGLGWLTEQVNLGAGDWGNFTPTSSEA